MAIYHCGSVRLSIPNSKPETLSIKQDAQALHSENESKVLSPTPCAAATDLLHPGESLRPIHPEAFGVQGLGCKHN